MLVFGKSFRQWVKSASGGRFRVSELKYSDDGNITDLIRPYLTQDNYTVVLYADTPLLRYSTIISLIEEMEMREQNVKKLKRGYIFNTNFIKSATNIYAPQLPSQYDDEFYAVVDANSYNVVYNIIKQRIMAYHLSKGVIIVNENTVTIDADVEIESGVVIHQNNAIFGSSVVKSGTILYPNNVIKDSYIGRACCLKGGYLENAKVQDGTTIDPFTKIIL